MLSKYETDVALFLAYITPIFRYRFELFTYSWLSSVYILWFDLLFSAHILPPSPSTCLEGIFFLLFLQLMQEFYTLFFFFSTPPFILPYTQAKTHRRVELCSQFISLSLAPSVSLILLYLSHFLYITFYFPIFCDSNSGFSFYTNCYLEPGRNSLLVFCRLSKVFAHFPHYRAHILLLGWLCVFPRGACFVYNCSRYQHFKLLVRRGFGFAWCHLLSTWWYFDDHRRSKTKSRTKLQELMQPYPLKCTSTAYILDRKIVWLYM